MQEKFHELKRKAEEEAAVPSTAVPDDLQLMATIACGMSCSRLYGASSKVAHLRDQSSRVTAGLVPCCLDTKQRIMRREFLISFKNYIKKYYFTDGPMVGNSLLLFFLAVGTSYQNTFPTTTNFVENAVGNKYQRRSIVRICQMTGQNNFISKSVGNISYRQKVIDNFCNRQELVDGHVLVGVLLLTRDH